MSISAQTLLVEQLLIGGRRDMSISGLLTVNGKLHVKGDLVVRGSVVVGNGGGLIVDGKRTVHGSVQGVIGTS